ncbi:MAG: hypothetical protein Q9227_005569 [Pyrenula ochraceoflavens]
MLIFLATVWICIVATSALRLTNIITAEDTLTRDSNLTFTWSHNKSDPKRLQINLHHESGSVTVLATSVTVSPGYFNVLNPFASFSTGERGRFNFLRPAGDGNRLLARSPVFELQNNGTISAINASIPIITSSSTSPTPAGSSSPTNSLSPSPAPSSSSSLSTGAKAGIGVGCAVGVLLICAIIFFILWRRRRRRQTRSTDPAPLPPPTTVELPQQGSAKIELAGYPATPKKSWGGEMDASQEGSLANDRDWASSTLAGGTSSSGYGSSSTATAYGSRGGHSSSYHPGDGLGRGSTISSWNPSLPGHDVPIEKGQRAELDASETAR